MYPLTRRWWRGAAILLPLTLAGCATFGVSSYRWPGADFARYQTFAWEQGDRLETGDPRLDNNTIFRSRIRDAVDGQLAMRGFSRTAAAQADLVIHVHARLDQRIVSREIDTDRRACERDADCGPIVYDVGTLLLDFVDTRTNAIAWRGWAEGSLDGVVDDQARLEEAIDEAVTKILKQLPPLTQAKR